MTFSISSASGSNVLVNLQDFLPKTGNYKDLCLDSKVLACFPNVDNPIECIMSCLAPKTGMSNIKYYPASINYNYKTNSVNTSNDGKIYLGQKIRN